MSNSIIPANTDQELLKVEEAIKKLRKVTSDDDEAEIVDVIRELALNVGKAANHKMRNIRRDQSENDGDVDTRTLSSVAGTLEKVSKSLDALSKRRQNKVDEATSLVNAEVERVKLQRGGTDLGDVARLIFPFQGQNRPTASPVLGILNSTNVKIEEAIDAEMEEILDDDESIPQNEVNVDESSDTNALSGSMA